MTSFLCVVCELAPEHEEELPALLAGEPVLGVMLEPAAGGWVRASVYLRADHEVAVGRVTATLSRLGGRETKTVPVERADWLAAYRNGLRPFPVGTRWWMDPHPDAPTPAPVGRLRLAVEPRMAFGTGSHESTRLVLLALEEIGTGGLTVLDVGTGSGVLALAAERLGATWVVALDVDPEAIWVARQIACQQEWEARPRFLLGPVASLGRASFDLVLCNMIPEQSGPLLGELLRLLARNGLLLLSGLLDSQLEEVARQLDAAGLHRLEERRQGEWVCVWARRRELR